MNILTKLRKPDLSIIIASVFLFVSCGSNNNEDVELQVQKEYKTTSIKNTKLSNNLNSLFSSKYAKKNSNSTSFDFDNVYEVENTETGEISYMVDSNNNEEIKLGVYPKDNGEYSFLIVEYINNGDNKEILYKSTSGETLIIVSANTNTQEVSVTYPNGKVASKLASRGCGELVAECLSDSYTKRGWTSVGLWIVTGFYPAFGIGAAAGCAAAVC